MCDSSFVGWSGTDSVSVCFDPGSIIYASTCKELDKYQKQADNVCNGVIMDAFTMIGWLVGVIVAEIVIYQIGK